jgi:F-type H+-transporting ATPase subunit b
MGLGAHLPLWLKLTIQFINFAILAGVLIYALRKPLKGFLESRRAAIKEKIEESERLLKEAGEAKKAYEEKLSKLEAEIQTYRSSVLREVEQEKKKILDEAQALASRIREQAKLAYEQEMKETMAKVRTEIAERTVRAAEQRVRDMFKKEDHDQMVDEFIQKVRSIN